MQAQLSKRFTVTLAAVLGTTVIPWLVYGKLLPARLESQLADARRSLASESAGLSSGRTPEELRKRISDLEREIRDSSYELRFGLDLQGGASITYRVPAGEGMNQADVLKDAIRVTEFRVNRLGVSEVDIKESGTEQFTVELPGRGKEEIDRIKRIMSTVGSLEFRIVAGPDKTDTERRNREAQKEKYVPSPGLRWYPTDEGGELLLEVPDVKAEDDWKAAEAAAAAAPGDAALAKAAADAKRAFEDSAALNRWTGKHLASVSYARSQEHLGYEVSFSIVPDRMSAFGDFTGAHVKEQMAIVLNESVHTAPSLESKLPGSGRIYSSANPYSQDQAQDLVTVLQSGSLKVKPEEISSFVVGPGLGEDAVRRGRWAVAISAALVVAFMAIFYYGAGWVANLAVLLNLVMTMGVLMFLGAALTLPGIAGLILTLGMAVDANILVNERIREEKATGKGLAQAISAGYDRAWITILDSNLTTILAGVVLYWVGTGPVRGFALTLILGLLISMFTACYVTRTLFVWGLEAGILKEFRMMPVMELPAYRYTAARAKTIGASAILIVLGTAAFVLRDRHEKYDLEFLGGERVIVALKRPLKISALQERVDGAIRAGFDREAKAAGEDATLGAVVVRTVRGRGADSRDLDLATESDRFELTAQVVGPGQGRSEKLGVLFVAEVRAALAEDLLPPAVEGVKLEGEPGKADRPFTAVVNLVGAGIDAAAVKAALARASTLAKPAEAKVEPAATQGEGVVSFQVAGATGAATDVALTDDLLRALRTTAALEPSDPLPQNDYIGPGVAERLRQQAIIAVLLSTLVQIVYLRVRFRDFTYGFAAAIIVAHNVLITLGAVAVADQIGLAHAKVSLPLIAAFLTLIGYSVNDTIVVFDRIRENLGRATHPTAGLIDRAISDTLARSIRTSITVFCVALAMFAANWNSTSSIEGFAFVMVIGVLTSAYASVFISSPMLLFLPVYSRTLDRLGRPLVLGLIAALFAGLGVAFTQQGMPAIIGGALACLLPAHFLVHLVGWLRQPDPDRLLKELEGASPGMA